LSSKIIPIILIPVTLDQYECFQFFITHHRTNNSNNATHYAKLGKKRRECSKRKYYIISPRVSIKAIIIIGAGSSLGVRKGADSFMGNVRGERRSGKRVVIFAVKIAFIIAQKEMIY